MDFEQIYREYFKDVFLYVRSLTTQEGLAEEITQETFTKALKAIDSYDGKKDIRAWLFTIAKNSFYTHCRQQKHYVEYELPKNCTDDFPCIEERLAEEETAFLIPFEKIGAIFGKSAGWARVTFYRGKKQIIAYMEGLEHERDQL